MEPVNTDATVEHGGRLEQQGEIALLGRWKCAA
jgi:hypothetical protein